MIEFGKEAEYMEKLLELGTGRQDRQFIDQLPKSTPLPPKVLDPPKKGYYKTTSCRRCGFGVSEAGWKYCPNCGQAILHYQYAGTQGWTRATAEKEFAKMMEVRS